MDNKNAESDKIIKVEIDLLPSKYNNCLKGQLPTIQIQNGLKHRFDIVVWTESVNH